MPTVPPSHRPTCTYCHDPLTEYAIDYNDAPFCSFSCAFKLDLYGDKAFEPPPDDKRHRPAFDPAQSMLF